MSLLAVCLLSVAVACAGAVPEPSGAAPAILDAKRLALQPPNLPASAKRMSEKQNRAATLPGVQRGQVYTTTEPSRSVVWGEGGVTHAPDNKRATKEVWK